MYNFLKYRVPSILFSLSIILVGVAAYVMKGGFHYSIDFTGGTEIRVRFEKPQHTEDIKKVIHDDWHGGSVYSVVGANELIVRVQDTPDKVAGLDAKIVESINKVSVDNKASVVQVNSISRSVSDNLWGTWLKAFIIALLLLVLYLSLTFKFAFAMGAVVAIVHDALIVLSVFLLLNKEISIELIGAVMAVLGYSINDTIIIFSRIRENLKRQKNETLHSIVNLSLNQTLRRTILTSAATALVVVSLFVFGGATIRDLALALLLGIVFGTFSSIYIASPIMMFFYREQK